jgi:hypothetical protein
LTRFKDNLNILCIYDGLFYLVPILQLNKKENLREGMGRIFFIYNLNSIPKKSFIKCKEVEMLKAIISISLIICGLQAQPIEEWVRTYNGNAGDAAHGIGIDGFGNIYVTGQSNGVPDIVTISYSNSGVQRWLQRYNGSGNYADYGWAITVSSQGNVYVTGSCYSSNTENDFITIKYNLAGVEEWTKTWDYNYTNDYAYTIAIDKEENVYITGESYLGSDGLITTIKYSATGIEQWRNSYRCQNPYMMFSSITVNEDGDVFVGATYDLNILTLKYDALGNLKWERTYPIEPWDYARTKIVTDTEGNVIVTAESFKNYVTMKYDSEGVEK